MYCPMTCPHDRNMYRVPMWIDDGEYMLAVGQDEYRNYTDETLPDIVKARMSMIKAFPKNVLPYYMVNALVPYANNHDERLEDIGWQVTEEMYMLVLPAKELASIKDGK